MVIIEITIQNMLFATDRIIYDRLDTDHPAAEHSAAAQVHAAVPGHIQPERSGGRISQIR